MSITITQIIKYLETLFPKSLAYDKDPIGLHLGTSNRPVTKVLVTLDVTMAVVNEAIEQGANFIVSHHPFIYAPLTSINTNTPKGKVIEQCLKHDICVYSMHTNYDIASNGMNDCLADTLGLINTVPLIPTKYEQYSKIAIYTPSTHVDEIRQLMGDMGVGKIGAYSHCTFATEGVGTFYPLEGSQPYIGALNQLEKVDEVKIEGIVPTELTGEVINRIKEVHPYEEMAYDIYEVSIGQSTVKYGLGRLGQVEHPIVAKDFIEHVKKSFNIDHARFIGKKDKMIKSVAIIGGSGSSYMKAVKMKKADLFITGDVGFHQAQDALDMGLNILDVGHHVECLMKEHVASLLNDQWEQIAVASAISTDPFQFV